MSEEDKHSQSTGEGRGVLQYIVHQKQYGRRRRRGGGCYIQPGLGVQINRSRGARRAARGAHGCAFGPPGEFFWCGACVTWRRPRSTDMLETPSAFTNFLLLIAPCGILFKMASRASTFSTLGFGSDLSIRSFKAPLKLSDSAEERGESCVKTPA